jgi:4-hydroxy-tetrahydrodipicolinate synthase
MTQHNWSGIHIPIVTPFRDDSSIDEAGLRRLVDYLIEGQKADSLVPCGTTGESPTLTHAEHNRVIEIVLEAVAGRVPVIAGTGSNSTQEAFDMIVIA